MHRDSAAVLLLLVTSLLAQPAHSEKDTNTLPCNLSDVSLALGPFFTNSSCLRILWTGVTFSDNVTVIMIHAQLVSVMLINCTVKNGSALGIIGADEPTDDMPSGLDITITGLDATEGSFAIVNSFRNTVFVVDNARVGAAFNFDGWTGVFLFYNVSFSNTSLTVINTTIYWEYPSSALCSEVPVVRVVGTSELSSQSSIVFEDSTLNAPTASALAFEGSKLELREASVWSFLRGKIFGSGHTVAWSVTNVAVRGDSAITFSAVTIQSTDLTAIHLSGVTGEKAKAG